MSLTIIPMPMPNMDWDDMPDWLFWVCIAIIIWFGVLFYFMYFQNGL